ncbi:autotransporter outer membrane beta-barrel domain-containing protein [Escherichia coli]|uniref:autotransporter outer membrane beta-barrel domain-containing protein n=1 Tax=Escherichia coli TaxID=562 RepID=UPI000F9A87CF|nr:autotransporter outer membrane beta-barrel domain-containing protein [Escherichia coli]HBY0199528.1 autotransporter outer membrane beta-barrel domain-containing protein [Klebsiella pneumoniae]EEV7668040.1 autotransporter outer membrane beta-barrel domain-containing protein [Escherichia coli]EEZ6573353.1 autotransporter outer membrane beta-barrel domain-containing protein [Escherichia coli]EHP8238316.1 autotransporter outer membrane beta-barrel domain-containing protein [Escherichia coli]EHY
MNKIYKLVWNASSGCWSVASEFARKGKPGRGIRRLILATGLLAVSGAAMAAPLESCTTDNNTTPKVMTCTHNSRLSPPHITIQTPDTIINVPKDSEIKGIGVAGATSLPTMLGNDKNLENNTIINSGTILWTKATGYLKRTRAALTLNQRGDNKNITSARIQNEKDGKIIIEADKWPMTGASLIAAFVSADAGTPVLNNDGEITIKSPDGVDNDNKEKRYGGYVRGKNPEVTNSGTVTIQALSQVSGFGLATSAKGGLASLINTGKVEVSSEAGAAVGVIAFGDNTSTSTLDNQGTITVSTTTGEATGAYSSVSGNITINNQSNITATATGDGVARGISAYGDNTSTSMLDNQGTITVSTTTGEATGAYASVSGGITINNQSNITATATEGGVARGISASVSDATAGKLTLTNTDTITASSVTGSASGIVGRSAGKDGVITNNKTVDVTASSGDSAGISAWAAGTANAITVKNTAQITLKGATEAKSNRGGVLLGGWNPAEDSTVTPVSALFKVINTETGVIDADDFSSAIAQDDSFAAEGKFAGSPVSVAIENTGTLKGGNAVNLYAGNNSFTQTRGTTTGNISMGDGNNTVTLSGGSVTGDTTAGKGNDLYILENTGVQVKGNVGLGDGNNTFMLVMNSERPADAPITGNLTAGSGNDILAMKNMTVKGNVDLGNGNNVLVLDNSLLGLTGETETAATTANDGIPGNITTGNGDDVLTLSGASVVRNISLGDGDNILAMSRAVIDGAVTAGGGDDRLMFVTDTDADTSGSAIPSDLYTVINNSGTDISLGDGNNTVIMDHDVTFSNGNNSIVTGKGNDAFIISNGTFNSNINAGDGDNTFTVTGGSLKGSITGGSGADTYSQSAGDVVGNLNAGDGFNDITLDGGTLTGNITTGAGDDIIFLSSGKYSGAVSTGAGDDLMYLGTSDASRSDVDISGLTRLDGGDNSDDIGDSLIVLRDLTGSTDSEGKAGDVHISGWENIDIGSEPVPADDLMARSAVESSAKTATLSLTGDLDVRSLKINSGSVLNLSDTTESAAVKGNLINAGTIDLTRQSSPSQTLSVTGNYTGSDALLKMNTVWNAPGDALGGNSQSDLLDITGTASGNTTVIPVSKDGRENVIDGDVRQVNHVINTVPVVKVHTPGEERAFTGTASTTGVSEVQLAKRTSNGVDEYFWTATAVETRDDSPQTDNGTRTDRGTPVSPVTPSDKGSSGPQIYNSAVAGYVSMPRVNMEQGYSTVATLHERRGENMALAWNAATPADGQTWGRLLGEHLKQDGKTRLDVHTDTYGFQFGHDFRITRDEDGAQRLTGGYVAYTRSDSSFYDRYRAEHGVISGDKYAGKGKSEAWSLGVTDTYYTAGGSYLDLVGQFSYLRNHYESRDNVKVSQNGWSGLLSAEAGHPFVLSGTDTGPGWLLEPQAQLAYQYVSLQKFSDGVRDVDQNGQSGLRGRVGARLAWNAQKGAERGTGTFYTLANLNHDFVNPGHVDIGRDSVREKYASTWMETGVGMQLPTGPSGYLYTEARYEKELGHTKRDGWQGTFGYKYTWK